MPLQPFATSSIPAHDNGFHLSSPSLLLHSYMIRNLIGRVLINRQQTSFRLLHGLESVSHCLDGGLHVLKALLGHQASGVGHCVRHGGEQVLPAASVCIFNARLLRQCNAMEHSAVQYVL